MLQPVAKHGNVLSFAGHTACADGAAEELARPLGRLLH